MGALARFYFRVDTWLFGRKKVEIGQLENGQYFYPYEQDDRVCLLFYKGKKEVRYIELKYIAHTNYAVWGLVTQTVWIPRKRFLYP